MNVATVGFAWLNTVLTAGQLRDTVVHVPAPHAVCRGVQAIVYVVDAASDAETLEVRQVVGYMPSLCCTSDS